MNENATKWHQGTPDAICKLLHTNAACGLSRKAARSRLRKQGRNTLFDSPTSKIVRILKTLLLDPALLLLLLSAVLAILFFDVLPLICTVLIVGSLIAALVYFLCQVGELSRIFVQYRTPVVRVVRDGRLLTVSVARVVAGDVLVLQPGDILPGDCRILASQGLRVLTLCPDKEGHPTYVEYAKRADATYPNGSSVSAPEAENMLYGGSEVLAGNAAAVLVALGEASYLGAMRAFSLPAEREEREGTDSTQRLLNPYFRLWSVLSLVLVAVLTVVGLFTKPNGGDLTELFLTLCIFCGSASPALLSLYLLWMRTCTHLSCLQSEHPKNRALVKSEGAFEKLASLTDLFVIGERGLSDGVTHVYSAFIKGNEYLFVKGEKNDDLSHLCEAMLLRHEAEKRMPAYASLADDADLVFLSELVEASPFDPTAMQFRLQSVSAATHPDYPTRQCITAILQGETVRFYFDSSETLLRQCVLAEDGLRNTAITPAYRTALRHFLSRAEANGCRTIAVARECGEGTLALVGVLALREQVSAVLPSVTEELAQSGVTTRFFLSNDEYARVCRLPEPCLYRSEEHPRLTFELVSNYRTFIGFSKEELSSLLPQLQRNGHRIAVLGGNTNDRCFLRAGVLTFACDNVTDLKAYAEDRITENAPACGKEGSRNASQVMRRHADVIIERADRFSGGVFAALQAVSAGRAMDLRLQMLLQFCFHSQIARLIITAFACLSGKGLFTALQMFLCSFATEIGALWFFASVPLSQSMLRASRKTDEDFLNAKLFLPEAFLPTVVPVGIVALTVSILGWANVISAPCAGTYLFLALFLLQITVFVRISVTSKVNPTPKTVFVAIAVTLGTVGLLTLLSCLIPAFGAVTGMGAWSILTACLLPLLPALYFLLLFLLPFLRRTAK